MNTRTPKSPRRRPQPDRTRLRQRLGHEARRAGEAVEIETVSTGSLGLDIALGIGGLPRGRIIEIYGPESSGKTTLALHVIAQAQKPAAPAPSSMPNMRSIPPMPASWASISTNF